MGQHLIIGMRRGGEKDPSEEFSVEAKNLYCSISAI